MRRIKNNIFGSFVLVLVCGIAFLGATPLEPIHKETKELMNMVHDASALVEKQGDKAFVEFSRKDSKWLQGEKYIFVIDTKGFVFVNPSRPELEGKNQINLKDLIGKPFIQSFINEVTVYPPRREGWTHYVWYKPGEEIAMWKTAYVKLVKGPTGKEYIVGSGFYNMKMDKVFVVDVVDKAADLIAKHGKKAFDSLKDPLGDFNYLTTYVFVLDSQGKDLVNPAFPGFEGQNVLNIKDSTGKYFIRDMMKGLEASDSIWVDYLWPKPRQATPSKKSAYVRKAVFNKEIFYVGSGVYFE